VVTPGRVLLAGVAVLAPPLAAGAGWFGGLLVARGPGWAHQDSPYALLGTPFLLGAALAGAAGWLTGGGLATGRAAPLRWLAPLAGLAGAALGAAATLAAPR
jgi:hypothetical protein